MLEIYKILLSNVKGSERCLERSEGRGHRGLKTLHRTGFRAAKRRSPAIQPVKTVAEKRKDGTFQSGLQIQIILKYLQTRLTRQSVCK